MKVAFFPEEEGGEGLGTRLIRLTGDAYVCQ